MNREFKHIAVGLAGLFCCGWPARPALGAFFISEFGASGERVLGQSLSDSSSTTIFAPGILGVEPGPSVLTTRVGFNVNADAGPDSAALEVGLGSYRVGAAFAHQQRFNVIIDFELRGQLLRVADQEGCLGSISVSDVAIPTLVRLRDGAEFPLDVVLAGDELATGATTAGIGLSRTAQRVLEFRDQPVGGDAFTIDFSITGVAISQSCEVSARFGAANGSTTNCSACEYPGLGDRTLGDDGLFVTMTFVDFCGNGAVDQGEQCDLGASTNGADGSCCNRNCEFQFARICRPAAGDCDQPETCTGDSALCPQDRRLDAGSPCTSDDDVCTRDACTAAGECVHDIVEGTPCEDGLFCNGQEACSAAGTCVALDNPPCQAGVICDEVGDTCGAASPTPTATLDSSAPTPTPGVCLGDCNGDGAVAIGELITGVNIALDKRLLTDCAAFDRDRDGRVAIGELIAGVRSALDGC